IQEYRDSENRDLWEFPLNLAPKEIDRLLRHLWELNKASFPYLLFTRNCSWRLMQLLDIAKPELNLSPRFNFWVIPSDAAKAALSAVPAAAPVWRPSLRKTAEQHGKPERPPSLLEAHESLRLGAGLVSLKNGPAYEIQGRLAMQDLLDAPEGYLPDAALETGSFRLRYEKRYNRLYMKEGRLARIISLNPWDGRTRRRSWEISAGVEQAAETGRQSGRSAIWAMNAGSGFAVEWRGPVRQLWYAMLQADSGFGPALNANWRAGAGIKAGLLAEKGPVRALFEARYISYAIGDTRPLWAGSAAASLRLARNSSARFEYSWRREVKEAGIYFHRFFFAP
ncbi:MAG: DUF4105 domain-containing protein, partial [Elusimicrobiota bacterium]